MAWWYVPHPGDGLPPAGMRAGAVDTFQVLPGVEIGAAHVGCLLPQVIILAFALAPRRLRFLVNAAISIAIPVVMLTWIVMPNLTRLLDAGLYAGTDGYAERISAAPGRILDDRGLNG